MTSDQKIVATGAATGVIAMILLLWLLYSVLPAPSGAEAVANRIAYALRWIALDLDVSFS